MPNLNHHHLNYVSVTKAVKKHSPALQGSYVTLYVKFTFNK
ncbi:hypothetical protein HMPREF1569_4963 [Klebsiella oxytoca OK-1]|nr:hypothetical protein HMPREF1569_4963 [Klebsiella oxytoca OK-1]